MNCEPVTCSANDLASVLAGIRERKCCPDRVETGVGGNGWYRVSYFQAAPEREARAEADAPRTPKAGSNPAVATHLPHQAKIPAQDIALRAVKSEVAPRDPLNDHRNPSLVVRQASEMASAAETVGVEDSIESRMAALQARLAAKGKLKRSKPATAARLPYSDT